MWGTMPTRFFCNITMKVVNKGSPMLACAKVVRFDIGKKIHACSNNVMNITTMNFKKSQWLYEGVN